MLERQFEGLVYACCKHGYPGSHEIINDMLSGRRCRLSGPDGFKMVRVGVQREPRNQVQKRNNQESRREDDEKSPLGRVQELFLSNAHDKLHVRCR